MPDAGLLLAIHCQHLVILFSSCNFLVNKAWNKIAIAYSETIDIFTFFQIFIGNGPVYTGPINMTKCQPYDTFDRIELILGDSGFAPSFHGRVNFLTIKQGWAIDTTSSCCGIVLCDLWFSQDLCFRK